MGSHRYGDDGTTEADTLPPVPPPIFDWKHPEVGPTAPIVLEPQPRRGLSQNAIVLCVIIGAIALVTSALALGGATDAASSIASVSVLLGFVLACVFHKRWM